MSCHKLLTATLSARIAMDLVQRSQSAVSFARRISDTYAWCGKDRLMWWLVNACWMDWRGTEPVIIGKHSRLILHFLLYGERFSVRGLWGMEERSPLCQGQRGRNGGTIESFLKLQHPSVIYPSSQAHPSIHISSLSVREFSHGSLENLAAVKYFCMMAVKIDGLENWFSTWLY